MLNDLAVQSISKTSRQKDNTMNQIIYIVGAIVIVLAILSFVGLS